MSYFSYTSLRGSQHSPEVYRLFIRVGLTHPIHKVFPVLSSLSTPSRITRKRCSPCCACVLLLSPSPPLGRASSPKRRVQMVKRLWGCRASRWAEIAAAAAAAAADIAAAVVVGTAAADTAAAVVGTAVARGGTARP